MKKVSFVEQNASKVLLLPIGSKLCMSPCIEPDRIGW